MLTPHNSNVLFASLCVLLHAAAAAAAAASFSFCHIFFFLSCHVRAVVQGYSPLLLAVLLQLLLLPYLLLPVMSRQSTGAGLQPSVASLRVVRLLLLLLSPCLLLPVTSSWSTGAGLQPSVVGCAAAVTVTASYCTSSSSCHVTLEHWLQAYSPLLLAVLQDDVSKVKQVLSEAADQADLMRMLNHQVRCCFILLMNLHREHFAVECIAAAQPCRCHAHAEWSSQMHFHTLHFNSCTSSTMKVFWSKVYLMQSHADKHGQLKGAKCNLYVCMYANIIYNGSCCLEDRGMTIA